MIVLNCKVPKYKRLKQLLSQTISTCPQVSFTHYRPQGGTIDTQNTTNNKYLHWDRNKTQSKSKTPCHRSVVSRGTSVALVVVIYLYFCRGTRQPWTSCLLCPSFSHLAVFKIASLCCTQHSACSEWQLHVYS